MDYSYSERLHAAQDAALERAYMASLQPEEDEGAARAQGKAAGRP